MFKKFKTKELIVMALISALTFVSCFLTGSVLNAAGIPVVGSFLNGVIMAFFYIIGALIVRKFGYFTIVGTLTAILSIPTATFGPPGVYKILEGLLPGITFDLIVRFFGRKKIIYYLGTIVSYIMVVFILYYAYIILDLPGVEEVRSTLPVWLIVAVATAVIGLYLGFKVYEKYLANKRIIKQIST